MAQKYKAVYFPDIPGDQSGQKSLTLAFGAADQGIFARIKELSSEELRQLLRSDYYETIAHAARAEDLPLNRYCLRQIKKSLNVLVRESTAQYTLPGIPNESNAFDPLSVTFKGGAQEPFVRWYPYLQGYSTEYVAEIIRKYAPGAKAILDPFAGTGTTVFTASRMGIKPYFCEVNPVLQFVCLVKVAVRQLKTADRLCLAGKLLGTKDDLNNLTRFSPDSRLKEAYDRCFGTSQFFSQRVFEEILRVRAWIDSLSLNNPQVGDLVSVAALSSLVPASNMTRIGDMRYKTPAESTKPPVNFVEHLTQRIENMAIDIQGDVNGLQVRPLLICQDARRLSDIPSLNIDAVITSPPYVNGTNYFRNTKIELWFMRCLNYSSDLARYRAKALTAGINDVTQGKVLRCRNSDVREIVRLLDMNAYDVRIPEMIDMYFAELTEIFSSIRRHLTANGVAAIDIGDSCYGGVHVPVDRLLSSCLADLGFVQKDVKELRRRRSKGGMVLSQKLLVYECRPTRTQAVDKPDIPSWWNGWLSFQTQLPHQQLPYSMRNWGHPLHSLCSYQGKMKPAIAHFLVDTFVPAGGSVLDPFAGVGTIPFEAALQGKVSYGFEISPTAYAIASGKTQFHDANRCEEMIKRLDTALKNDMPTEDEWRQSEEFGFNGRLSEYYHHDTLKEILLTRRFFIEHPAQNGDELFVLASLLHILHGNRPYALSRRSHPITPYKPTGPTEYRPLVSLLREKVGRGLKEPLPEGFTPSTIVLQDATAWWPQSVGEIDSVITSPPFFDSTRFYLANWIRLWFCGWDQTDFAGRPLGFVDERQKVSFDVYIPVLRQAREHLRKDGVVVFHLGRSRKCDMGGQLARLGKGWFHSSEVYEESVSHCESHGIRDKGTVEYHQYLVLH